MFAQSVQRGMEVAKQRLAMKDLKDDDIVESFEIDFESNSDNARIKALESQISTLTLINESRELEIRLLKQQLLDEFRFQNSHTTLMDSFSNASEKSLEHAFSALEKHLNVSDIHQVTSALVDLTHTKDQFNQLVQLLDPPSADVRKAFLRASQLVDEVVASDLKSKKNSVAWSIT